VLPAVALREVGAPAIPAQAGPMGTEATSTATTRATINLTRDPLSITASSNESGTASSNETAASVRTWRHLTHRDAVIDVNESRALS